MIPRLAHFVFGLNQQQEPFHFLHYVSVESCRRVLQPEKMYFHHKHLPWGWWWERIRPQLTLVEVDDVDEVLAADYAGGRVPEAYRYAHHADFIRLDALLEHGGVYADIDTIFVRPFPNELFDNAFVIGREPAVRDELSGAQRRSLCNALVAAEPGAEFARAWRAEMADALNGTWSNHSGFLAEQLRARSPDMVHVEPEATFFPFPASRGGLYKLLERRVPLPDDALTVHLWAHLWWDRGRRDFSPVHAGWCTPPFLRGAPTTLADLTRAYLSGPAIRRSVQPREGAGTAAKPASPLLRRWGYLSLDEDSGYGTAAQRCIAALEDAGVEVEWTPFVRGSGWGLSYQPWLPLAVGPEPPDGGPARAADFGTGSLPGDARTAPPVLVTHLVPEFLPLVRAHVPETFLVAYTVWDTDRIPDHWLGCFDQADLVVVPSTFSADAVAASPVSAPVEVVPHVAPEVGSDRAVAPLVIAEDIFVFYTIAEWTERKAIMKTIEAYLRAFTSNDRVLLIVKTTRRDMRKPPAGSGAAGEGTSAWAVAQLMSRHRRPPAIKLITRHLTNAQIDALHRQGDCYVSLCRSEGFGLGAFDAAAHGNPVVTTGFGGHLDFLSASPYLVRFELAPVVDPAGYPSYAPEQRWAEPDIDHGAALLRQVADSPGQAAGFAEALAVQIRRRYSPESVAARFRAIVERRVAAGSRAAAAVAASRRS